MQQILHLGQHHVYVKLEHVSILVIEPRVLIVKVIGQRLVSCNSMPP